MRTLVHFVPALLVLACAATGSKPAEAPNASANTAAPTPLAAAPGPAPSGGAESSGSLPEPAWLPSEAREMLSARMDRHGEVMMMLLVSVMTLQHSDTELLAEQVAAEPRLGRPATGETVTPRDWPHRRRSQRPARQAGRARQQDRLRPASPTDTAGSDAARARPAADRWGPTSASGCRCRACADR